MGIEEPKLSGVDLSREDGEGQHVLFIESDDEMDFMGGVPDGMQEEAVGVRNEGEVARAGGSSSSDMGRPVEEERSP